MSSPDADALARTRTTLAIAAVSVVVFALTLFPGVGGLVNHGDSAKFQFLGVVPGIGHAPGNPLYLLLLRVVQSIPFGEPAMRANFASALCGALAVALVGDASYRLGGRVAAIGASCALALGGLFWTFATEAEVYALAAVFVALVFHSLVRAEIDRDGRALGVALAAYLLGIANHLSLAFAFPALVVAAYRLMRAGVRPARRDWLLVSGAALATFALYVAMPFFQSRGGLAYSEYTESLDVRGFFAFVGAERFRSELAVPTLEQAIRDRPRAMLSLLDRQWMLPVWLLVPVGAMALARRASATGSFVFLALAGWLGFAFAYQIPDSDGFYMPVVVACAPLLGLFAASTSRPRIALLVLLLALAPGATLFLRGHRDAVAFDVLEDVANGPPSELLDLPDLVHRIPRGALLALPCAHYGCVEVSNYYRFADPTARARHIEIVTIEGGTPYPIPSPPRSVAPAIAASRVVCTIHPWERSLLSGHGADMRELPRGFRVIHGERIARVPVFCSAPR
jgi:hypothetical protein